MYFVLILYINNLYNLIIYRRKSVVGVLPAAQNFDEKSRGRGRRLSRRIPPPAGHLRQWADRRVHADAIIYFIYFIYLKIIVKIYQYVLYTIRAAYEIQI